MNLHTECHKTIAQLRERCEYLEAELSDLKSREADGVMVLAGALKLSRQQAKLLFILSDGYLHDTLSVTHKIRVKDESEAINPRNILWVVADKIAKRSGICIKSHWGLGVSLEGKDLSKVKAILKGEPHV